MAKLQKPKNKSTNQKEQSTNKRQSTNQEQHREPETKTEDGRCERETQVHKGNTKQQTHGNRVDEERGEDKDLNTQGMIN